MRSFHAELSSLIYNQNISEFPFKKWRKFNKDRYTRNAPWIIGKSGIADCKEEYLQNGFLNRYAQTDEENDFNEVFKFIYTNDSRLDDFVIKHENIAGKVELVKKFMKDIE